MKAAEASTAAIRSKGKGTRGAAGGTRGSGGGRRRRVFEEDDDDDDNDCVAVDAVKGQDSAKMGLDLSGEGDRIGVPENIITGPLWVQQTQEGQAASSAPAAVAQGVSETAVEAAKASAEAITAKNNACGASGGTSGSGGGKRRRVFEEEDDDDDRYCIVISTKLGLGLSGGGGIDGVLEDASAVEDIVAGGVAGTSGEAQDDGKTHEREDEDGEALWNEDSDEEVELAPTMSKGKGKGNDTARDISRGADDGIEDHNGTYRTRSSYRRAGAGSTSGSGGHRISVPDHSPSDDCEQLPAAAAASVISPKSRGGASSQGRRRPRRAAASTGINYAAVHEGLALEDLESDDGGSAEVIGKKRPRTTKFGSKTRPKSKRRRGTDELGRFQPNRSSRSSSSSEEELFGKGDSGGQWGDGASCVGGGLRFRECLRSHSSIGWGFDTVTEPNRRSGL